MKRLLTFFAVSFGTFAMAQSIIGSVNSGGVFSENFVHAVGEIYVIPTNPDETSSGILGVLYQVELTTLSTLEITSEDARFYPNPTTGILYITFKSNQKPETITVVNSNGQTVLKQIYKEQLNLRELSAGVYFIQFPATNIAPIKIIKK